MFSKLFSTIAAAAAVVSVISKPLPQMSNDLVTRGNSVSFNNWNNIASLAGFDNFNGLDNFSGLLSSSSIVVIQEEQRVCRTQKIEIIQQRLLIIQEMAKKIITEQICEVETQTIVFAQFQSGLGNFGKDVRRKSNNNVGYDKNIASRYKDILSSDGNSVSDNDLGFTGKDLGKNYVVPAGNNWNDQSSPSIVESAHQAARNATKDAQKD